ncbi:MAG: hypothetical protein LBT53_08925 [Puniceicoccales bacterium]|nr:hypothetical protein [Puniceicoccales bacterium]
MPHSRRAALKAVSAGAEMNSAPSATALHITAHQPFATTRPKGAPPPPAHTGEAPVGIIYQTK